MPGVGTMSDHLSPTTMKGVKRLLAVISYTLLVGYVIYYTYYKQTKTEEIIRGRKLIKDEKPKEPRRIEEFVLPKEDRAAMAEIRKVRISAASSTAEVVEDAAKTRNSRISAVVPVVPAQDVVHSFWRQHDRILNESSKSSIYNQDLQKKLLEDMILSRNRSVDGMISHHDNNSYASGDVPYEMIFHRFPPPKSSQQDEENEKRVVPEITFDQKKKSHLVNSQSNVTGKSHSSVIEVWNPPDRKSKKYAVMGCSLPWTVNDINYPFFLFLDIYAWRRIGYESILLLAGSQADWSRTKLLNYTLSKLKSTGAVIAFVDGAFQNNVMLSQVSRLFASVIVPWIDEDTMIVLSDADIWPVDDVLFNMPALKSIITSNSECCGHFSHSGQMYRMLPMCYIGMTVKTWREVMQFPNQQLTDSEDILKYAERFYGDLAYRTIEKGENDGWFLDQHIVSIQIQHWANQHGVDKIEYIPRNLGRDRVDKTMWLPWNLADKRDAHLPDFAHRPGIWERLKPLIALMFSGKQCALFDEYRDKFLHNFFITLDDGS